MLSNPEPQNKTIILEKRLGSAISPDPPQVSVIIPAYNCSKFIRETLDSVFSQTFTNFETIFVNDGSSDTEELEEILVRYFDSLVYIKQENCGTAAARNTAIKNARGEFLAFLDADDVWLPEYLASQIEAITEKNCDMIYADAFLFGDLVGKNKRFMEECPSNGKVTPRSLISGECNVINSGTVARREIILRAGMFDESLPRIGMEDFDLWFRLARLGARIEYQKKVLLKYRLHEMSLSGNSLQRAERDVTALKLIRTKYELSADEKETLNNQLKCVSAALEIERGRYNLVEENFDLARENLRSANEHYKKIKYTAFVWLLAVTPKLLLRLFTKARPVKVQFILDDTSELKNVSTRSKLDDKPFRN